MTAHAPDFVARRLNSIIKQILDIEKSGKIPSFNRAEIIWNAYSELHGNILEHVDVDNFFPDFRPHNVHHSEELLEIVKTRIREIADNFLLTLDIDKTGLESHLKGELNVEIPIKEESLDFEIKNEIRP